MALGTAALVTLQDQAICSPKTVRVLPGEAVRIIIPDNVLFLRLVDETSRAPLPGRELELWYPREIGAASEVMVTGGDGEIGILPTSFPLLLRRPGPAVWQSELVPLSPGMTRCGFGGPIQTMIRIEAVQDSAPMLVGIRPCGPRIRMIDAASSEPVEAAVRVQRRSSADCPDPDAPPYSDCTLWSPRSPFGKPDEVYSLTDGLLTLPCVLGSFAGAADDLHDLVFLAAGYRPCAGSLSNHAVRAADAVPTYLLQRADPRMLRVVHMDGTPFTQAVAIYSPRENVMCLRNDGNAAGLHGPFDWYGGNLLVALGLGAKSWDRVLTERELSAAETVSLVLPDDTGSIVVTGIPDGASGASLIAKLGVGLEGREFRPIAVSKGECRFPSLPAGSYLVGPRSWVQGAEFQSVSFHIQKEQEPHATRTAVVPGKTSKVPWIGSWRSGRRIKGQVRMNGPARLEPLIFALYGAEGIRSEELPGDIPWMFFGRRSPRVPLDAEGSYCIEPEDPLPRLMAICVADDTTWGDVTGMHILDVLIPGESIDIRTGSVELRPTGESPCSILTVSYEIPVATLRHPLQTHYSRCACSWDGRSLLCLDGIPIQVSKLQIGDKVVPVELSDARSCIVPVGF